MLWWPKPWSDVWPITCALGKTREVDDVVGWQCSFAELDGCFSTWEWKYVSVPNNIEMVCLGSHTHLRPCLRPCLRLCLRPCRFRCVWLLDFALTHRFLSFVHRQVHRQSTRAHLLGSGRLNLKRLNLKKIRKRARMWRRGSENITHNRFCEGI